jgi:hypothetical protein
VIFHHLALLAAGPVHSTELKLKTIKQSNEYPRQYALLTVSDLERVPAKATVATGRPARLNPKSIQGGHSAQVLEGRSFL